MRRLVALLLPCLVAGAGLVACGDQGSAAGTGDVVVGHVSDKVTGDSTYVLLPSGRIDLTVGKPVEEVTAEQAADDESHTAPDGGAFVPVTWEHDPFGEGAVPVNIIGAAPQEADVVLVSGGTKADLGSPYQLAGEQGTTDTGIGTMYVAVDGNGEDPTFEVSYDGLTQTVDPATGEREAGVAEPLYAEPTMGVEAPCTSEGFTSGPVRPDVSCLVNAPQLTPYLPGQGWAEDGHTWLLVSVDITLSGVHVGRTAYDVTSVQPHLTVNDAEPLPPDGRYASAEPLPSAVRDTWAFDGSAHAGNTLAIGLDLVLERTSGAGPSTRRATVQQSVDLGSG